MTMKVQEQKITTERKHHPNESRYPCRATHEILDAGRKFISSLSQSEREELLNNDLILDEEETAELFDEIKENDIIGLGILKKDGFTSNLYRVVKVHKDEDWLECENAKTGMFEEISFQDVSVGFAIGFAEILYRDDKPFGISSEIEWSIQYEIEEEEDKNSTGTSVEADAEASKSSNEANSTPTTDIQPNSEEDSSASDEDLNEEPQQEESKESQENSEPTIGWTDVYYAFGYDYNDMTSYVVVTPKQLWDSENIIDDQSTVDALAEKIGLERLFESTYEYNHKYSEAQLRQLFTAFGAIENTDMLK